MTNVSFTFLWLRSDFMTVWCFTHPVCSCVGPLVQLVHGPVKWHDNSVYKKLYTYAWHTTLHAKVQLSPLILYFCSQVSKFIQVFQTSLSFKKISVNYWFGNDFVSSRTFKINLCGLFRWLKLQLFFCTPCLKLTIYVWEKPIAFHIISIFWPKGCGHEISFVAKVKAHSTTEENVHVRKATNQISHIQV